MVWDDTAKRVAIKTIGTVESNLRYDAINYIDAITVGFAQWYGTRAANLLNQIRGTSAWTGVTDRVDDALQNNAETNATFWTSFFLGRDDGNSLKIPLTSQVGMQVQNAQMIADLDTYIPPANSRGLNHETNTQAFIYYAQLYHQSPRYANQVLVQAGVNPTLERLHTLASNHSWYSRFRTRLNTARTIILAMDDDLPDEFDPVEPDEGGDIGGDVITPIASDVSRVTMVGNQILIYSRSGVITCAPTTNSREWIPQNTGSGPPIADPTDPDPPADPPTDPTDPVAVQAAALRQFLIDRIDAYTYRQAPGRLTPDSSGFTDCSALMYYAYHSVLGYTLSQFGSYTVEQNARGRNIFSVSQSNPPESILQVGDLVFFSNDTTFQRVRHVEMYIGNGQLIGYGGARPRGPYIKPNYLSYVNSWRWKSVRRHLQW